VLRPPKLSGSNLALGRSTTSAEIVTAAGEQPIWQVVITAIVLEGADKPRQLRLHLLSTAAPVPFGRPLHKLADLPGLELEAFPSAPILSNTLGY